MAIDYDAEQFTCPFLTRAGQALCATTCDRANCTGHEAVPKPEEDGRAQFLREDGES